MAPFCKSRLISRLRGQGKVSKLSISIFIAISLQGCSILPSQMQLSSQQQASEPPTPLQADLSQTKSLSLQWLANGAPAATRFSRINPKMIGNVLASAGLDQVQAWDSQNGKLLWQQSLGETVTGGIGASDELLFIGTENGNAVTLEAKTGKTRWVAMLGSKILSVSAEKNGKVAYRTLDGRLSLLSSRNGELIWQHTEKTPVLSMQGASTPVMAGPYVISGYDTGNVVAYDLESGKEAWNISLGKKSGLTELASISDIDAEMKTVGAALFVASYQGYLVGINMQLGKTAWKQPLSTYSGIDADQNGMYIANEEGKIIKLNPATGEQLWKNEDLVRRQPTTPTLANDGTIIVGDLEGYLHVIDANSGKIVGRIKSENNGYVTAPLVTNRVIYSQGRNGLITAHTLK